MLSEAKHLHFISLKQTTADSSLRSE